MAIIVEELTTRVLVSTEKVKFSQVDPYGHLNAARYLEFMANHRIEAAEDQLACFTLDILRDIGIGFVMADARVQFLRPSLCGEVLEISSWLKGVSSQGFGLRVVIASAKSRSVKSIGDIEFRSVRADDGKAAPMPVSLPSRSREDLLSQRPIVDAYKSTLKFPSGVTA